MITTEYMRGFRAALDVLAEYTNANTQQEFLTKYGLRLAWGDSILLAIQNHALAVAEIYEGE